MTELKPNVFYYLYTDGKKMFISMDEPIRADKGGWEHPDKPLKVCGKPFMVGDDPKSAEHITDFVDIIRFL